MDWNLDHLSWQLLPGPFWPSTTTFLPWSPANMAVPIPPNVIKVTNDTPIKK